MNSIWNNLYDKCKDRRYGVLFFISLGSVFGMCLAALIMAHIIGSSNLEGYFLPTLPATGILVVVWIVRTIRQSRQRARYEILPLSRDEICKARSKLVRQK